MIIITQAEIDEATMIAKNATYRLAYELSLDKKYGGDIDCCVTKLKLLWMYTRAIMCEKGYVAEVPTINSIGTYTVNTIGADTGYIALFITTDYITIVSIGGATWSPADPTPTPDEVAVTIAAGLTSNGYPSTSDGNVVTIQFPCNYSILYASTFQATGIANVTTIGTCGSAAEDESTTNCLSQKKIKNLIAKIKSLCTN